MLAKYIPGFSRALPNRWDAGTDPGIAEWKSQWAGNQKARVLGPDLAANKLYYHVTLDRSLALFGPRLFHLHTIEIELCDMFFPMLMFFPILTIYGYCSLISQHIPPGWLQSPPHWSASLPPSCTLPIDLSCRWRMCHLRGGSGHLLLITSVTLHCTLPSDQPHPLLQLCLLPLST